MKTILIANQKGGCGKTLVVDELAFSFDRTDVKYSLYDLDGQGGKQIWSRWMQERRLLENGLQSRKLQKF